MKEKRTFDNRGKKKKYSQAHKNEFKVYAIDQFLPQMYSKKHVELDNHNRKQFVNDEYFH